LAADEDLEDLMARYQQGEAIAADALIEQASARIFPFFLSQVRDHSLASDLLQDFWLRVHSARRTYRPPAPVLPWMYAIARRVRVDRFRKTRRIAAHEVQVETLPDRPQVPERDSGTVDFGELLAALPDSQREVIMMLKVSGLSLEEVALATRSSIGSVKQKAHRAYTRLRCVLGNSPKARSADEP
jgi:RNA polymerase sigma-70 factor (ECF subfamily)